MTRIQRRRTRKQPLLKKCLSNRLTRGNTAPEIFRATRNHIRVGRRPYKSKKIMSQLLKGSRRNNALRFTVSFSGVHVGGGLVLDDSFDYSVLAALGADGGPSLCAWSFYRPTASSRLLENWRMDRCLTCVDGWLHGWGTTSLGVRVGDEVSYVCFGVYENVSVPVIPGRTFIDYGTMSTSWKDRCVPLRSGVHVPSLQAVAPEPEKPVSWVGARTCPKGTSSGSNCAKTPASGRVEQLLYS